MTIEQITAFPYSIFRTSAPILRTNAKGPKRFAWFRAPVRLELLQGDYRYSKVTHTFTFDAFSFECLLSMQRVVSDKKLQKPRFTEPF